MPKSVKGLLYPKGYKGLLNKYTQRVAGGYSSVIERAHGLEPSGDAVRPRTADGG